MATSMHWLNTRSACLGGKSDILLTEQLFLRFILNLGKGNWFCDLTRATAATGVEKGTFFRYLLLCLEFGPLALPVLAENPLTWGQPQKHCEQPNP